MCVSLCVGGVSGVGWCVCVCRWVFACMCVCDVQDCNRDISLRVSHHFVDCFDLQLSESGNSVCEEKGGEGSHRQEDGWRHKPLQW